MGDDDAFDIDGEPLENVLHQIMSQGPFLGCALEEHADDHAHILFHLNDKDLLVVAHKNGASALGGQYPPYFNRHHIAIHTHQFRIGRGKNKPSCAISWAGPPD